MARDSFGPGGTSRERTHRPPMTARREPGAQRKTVAMVRGGLVGKCPTCGVEIRVLRSSGLVPPHLPRPDAAQCVASGRKFVTTSTSTTSTRMTRHVCSKCGSTVKVGTSGRVYNHEDRRTGERCEGSRLKVGPSRKQLGRTRREKREARPIQLRPPAADPKESVGRRPGPCPLCGARVAYDDDLRMNLHCFAGSTAECAASDREYRWMPTTVDEALPKRQRGGGQIPPKELERLRRVVTKAVGRHLDALRSSARADARRADASRLAASNRKSKARSAKPSSPELVRCVACGTEFQRSARDTSRRCTICDPPRSSSVRAYSGGLPGLGRRS